MIPEGIPSQGSDVSLHIHPESDNKIHNQRRAHRKEGNINEPGSDTNHWNSNPFSKSGTHPIQLPFYKISQAVHPTNLNIIYWYR